MCRELKEAKGSAAPGIYLRKCIGIFAPFCVLFFPDVFKIIPRATCARVHNWSVFKSYPLCNIRVNDRFCFAPFAGGARTRFTFSKCITDQITSGFLKYLPARVIAGNSRSFYIKSPAKRTCLPPVPPGTYVKCTSADVHEATNKNRIYLSSPPELC